MTTYKAMMDVHNSKSGLYVYPHKWVLLDAVSLEFNTCDRCQSEAPLYEYGNHDKEMLCDLCATVGSADISFVRIGNSMLRILGAFDNVEVVTE